MVSKNFTTTEKGLIAFVIIVLVLGFFLKEYGCYKKDEPTLEETRQEVLGE